MRNVLFEIIHFPPYAAGWIAGSIVKFYNWCVDTFTVGYEDGLHGNNS